jgi:inosine-uridine nucleoside N-ribohydrolase
MTLSEIVADIKSDRRKKVILDTDTYNEIDDQYALAYCYLSDKIDLLSVNAAPFLNDRSESYADGMEKSYHEAIKTLKLVDPEFTTPVYRGSVENLLETGRDFTESEAVDNIIKTVRESDEIVYVLAIGGITNVTSAIMMAPDIKDNMCVIWLGAHMFGHDDIYEFNLYQDLRASQLLVNSGVPLLLCPAWCVTAVLSANMGHFRDLRSGDNNICEYLYSITEEYYIGAGSPERWTRIIWDIAAPAILDRPECADIEIVTAPVFTDDYHYAFDSSRHKMMYLKGLDREIVYEGAWKAIKSAKKY